MFQQVIIVGNLGRDPQTRDTPDGKPVTNLSVATNRKWNNADGTPGDRPSGSRSPPGASWPRSASSTCPKDGGSWSKAACVLTPRPGDRASGRGRTAPPERPTRSSPARSGSWTATAAVTATVTTIRRRCPSNRPDKGPVEVTTDSMGPFIFRRDSSLPEREIRW